jgi:hypothetical protein
MKTSVTIILSVVILFIFGFSSLSKEPVLEPSTSQPCGEPLQSLELDGIKGNLYTPKAADLLTALDMYCWEFNTGDKSIEIGFMKNGNFKLYYESEERCQFVRVFLQRVNSSEHRLIVIGDDRYIVRALAKDLGSSVKTHSVPLPVEHHFELMCFSDDPRVKGWPQQLIAREHKPK